MQKISIWGVLEEAPSKHGLHVSFVGLCSVSVITALWALIHCSQVALMIINLFWWAFNGFKLLTDSLWLKWILFNADFLWLLSLPLIFLLIPSLILFFGGSDTLFPLNRDTFVPRILFKLLNHPCLPLYSDIWLLQCFLWVSGGFGTWMIKIL